jgi:CheY-like chemotaxis protein
VPVDFSAEIRRVTSLEKPIGTRVLLVDDDQGVRYVMIALLELKGFEVVTAACVTEALKFITTEKFDVLITDLHMPNAGDGFSVVTAMRHSQPEALNLLMSGYPDIERAMATIALEADEIIVKPFESARLPELIRQKLLGRKPTTRVEKERVSAILHRCQPAILVEWLTRAKQSQELNRVKLGDEERTGHLPKLIADLVARLDKSGTTLLNGDSLFSASAVEHGKLRYQQGYTSAMLVHESRILQVTLFGTLQNSLSCLDFSLLLPDVMKIADEVDAQLTQTMESFTKAMQGAWRPRF